MLEPLRGSGSKGDGSRTAKEKKNTNFTISPFSFFYPDSLPRVLQVFRSLCAFLVVPHISHTPIEPAQRKGHGREVLGSVRAITLHGQCVALAPYRNPLTVCLPFAFLIGSPVPWGAGTAPRTGPTLHPVRCFRSNYRGRSAPRRAQLTVLFLLLSRHGGLVHSIQLWCEVLCMCTCAPVLGPQVQVIV